MTSYIEYEIIIIARYTGNETIRFPKVETIQWFLKYDGLDEFPGRYTIRINSQRKYHSKYDTIRVGRITLKYLV